MPERIGSRKRKSRKGAYVAHRVDIVGVDLGKDVLRIKIGGKHKDVVLVKKGHWYVVKSPGRLRERGKGKE